MSGSAQVANAVLIYSYAKANRIISSSVSGANFVLTNSMYCFFKCMFMT